ncbi:MAG: heavy metal-associated domain-containing protein [Elusimicrobiota bacterium]
MKALAFLLAAALTTPAFAAATVAREFTELPPGHYTIAVTGLISTVCARAISVRWSQLPEVESAFVDFDKSTASVTIRIDRTLKVSSLRETLRRAERLANLGARYDLHEIAYRIDQ